MSSKSQQKKLFFFLEDIQLEKTFSFLPETLEGVSIKSRFFQKSIKELIKEEKKISPCDLLFIQLKNPDIPVKDIKKLVSKTPKQTKIIVLGEQNDITLYKNLLALGVNDYIALPIDPQNFLQLVSFKLDSNTRVKDHALLSQGKIISFLGARGGIGTSTLCVNTAWRMSKISTKVAIVSMGDVNGLIASYFGIYSSRNVYDCSSPLDETEPLDSLSNSINPSLDLYNIDILYSQRSEEDFYNNFSLFLQQLSLNYHYTLIDLPHGCLMSITEEIIRLSDKITLVTDLTLHSLKSGESIFSLLKNNKQKKVHLVANMKNLYQRGEVPLNLFSKHVDYPIEIVFPFDAEWGAESLSKTKLLGELSVSYNQKLTKFLEVLTGNKQKEDTSLWDKLFSFSKWTLRKRFKK